MTKGKANRKMFNEKQDSKTVQHSVAVMQGWKKYVKFLGDLQNIISECIYEFIFFFDFLFNISKFIWLNYGQVIFNSERRCQKRNTQEIRKYWLIYWLYVEEDTMKGLLVM